MNEVKEEIKRMGFDAEMAENLFEIVKITREAAIEECARAAEKAWPPARTYASENADLYLSQDRAVRKVVNAIRALSLPSHHGETP